MEAATGLGPAALAAALREALRQGVRAAELCCAAAGPGAVTTTAEFTALFSSVSFVSGLLSSESDAWLDPVLELRVIPAAAALLDCMLQADCAIALALASSSPADRGEQALEAGRLLLEPLQLIEACTIAACTQRPDCPADGRRISLLEQLAEDAVARVVARIPAFVQQGLWSRVEGVQGTHGVPLSCRAGADVLGGWLLSAAACYTSGMLHTHPNHGSGAAAALVKQRFLGALGERGLLSSLSAALLAAPPWPQVAADAQAVDGYTRVVVLVQRALIAALFNAQAPVALLMAPDVLLLRQELLEQVAAATDGGPGQDGGGGGGGADAWGARGGAAGGGGGSSARQRQPWPLFNRGTMKLLYEDSGELPEHLFRSLTVALAVPLHFSSAAANDPPTSNSASSARAALAAAEQLFPSRAAAAALAARACASLHAHVQQLGPPDAARSPGLAECATNLALTVIFRLRGAPLPEVRACLPDLLAMLGWCLALLATPAGLAHATEKRVVANVALIASCMHGTAFGLLSNLRPIRLVSGCRPDTPAGFWASLSASVRAACVRRLQPTGLPRSLDRLLRWMVSNGCQLEGPDGVSMLLHTCLTELLGPLLRARLVEGRVRHQLQQQQQQLSPPVAGEGSSAAAGASGSLGTARAGGGWRAREELGLVLTALKLLRREAGKQAASVGSGEPEMLLQEAPLFSLALFVVQLGCADHGLVSLLPELLACAERAGAAGPSRGCHAGEGDASSGPGAADLCMVAQAVAACAAAALPVTTQLLEQAADRLQHEQAQEAAEAAGRRRSTASAPGNGGDDSSSSWIGCLLAPRMHVAGVAVRAVIKHLPASALLALAPQRAVVALARIQPVLQQRVQRQLAQGAPGVLPQDADQLLFVIVHTIVLLSADEQLLEGCVPGWMWASGGPLPARAEAQVKANTTCDVAALARLVGPSYTPQQGPIVVIESASAEVMRFNLWRWTDHRRHRAEVAALARACAQELGLMETGRAWQVTDGAGGAGAMWPPRLLRLCGHPSCGNYGGDCEADLQLQKCSGCRSVRYCGAACQKQHWRRHKEDCERWAAADEA